MYKIKKYGLLYDSIMSIGLLLIIYLLINLLNFPNINLTKYSGVLIGLFGSLLGFLITATTILFMFDYKSSEILKRIKKIGLYNQIFERYIFFLVLCIWVLNFSILNFLLKYNYQNLISWVYKSY